MATTSLKVLSVLFAFCSPVVVVTLSLFVGSVPMVAGGSGSPSLVVRTLTGSQLCWRGMHENSVNGFQSF